MDLLHFFPESNQLGSIHFVGECKEGNCEGLCHSFDHCLFDSGDFLHSNRCKSEVHLLVLFCCSGEGCDLNRAWRCQSRGGCACSVSRATGLLWSCFAGLEVNKVFLGNSASFASAWHLVDVDVFLFGVVSHSWSRQCFSVLRRSLITWSCFHNFVVFWSSLLFLLLFC